MSTELPPPPPGRFAWRSPRQWSLRVKFSVVLLVPLVLALALGGVRIADQTSEALERDQVAQFVNIQGVISSLIVEVERERYRSAEFVAYGRVDGRALQAVIESVDHRAEQSRSALEGVSDDVAGLGLIRRQAEYALGRLPTLREVVSRPATPATTVVARYTDLLEQLVQLNGALLRAVNTAEVLGLANSLAELDAARNEATLQQAQMVIAVQGPLDPSLAAELQFSGARLASTLTDFRVALDAEQRLRHGRLTSGPANAERNRLVQSVLGGVGAAAGNDVQRIDNVYGALLGDLDATAEGVRSELRITTADRRQSAIIEAWLNVALLLLALIVGAVIVGVVARAMIRSLRTLRRSAILVAQERLPEAVQRMRRGAMPNVNVNPVPVTTREEVGQVARAFDAVHLQAVRLAAEQATLQRNMNSMYVNLSRRSQALVDRQLLLIEQLEGGEEDPEQLADLFRLDHLATRMRRNSENLLVLSGTELQRPAAEPVPVQDVLRAAVSEIEQYQRVVVQNCPDAVFVGEAANDIQHLVAELLDNATNFSSTESQVVMSCSRARDDSILVEIFDKGVGLSADELATLNARLHDPSEATASVAASQRMGLFVVGRLANRHGIWVGLFTDSMGPSRSADGPGKRGVTARVTIPAHLVGERKHEPDQILWSRFEATPPAPAQPRALVASSASDGEPEVPGRHEPSGDDTMQLPVVLPDPVSEPTAQPAAQPAAQPEPATVSAGVQLSVPVAVPDAASAADSLFEPLVPPLSLPDPDAPRPPDPFAGSPHYDEGDATPIFAEVTSGWFHAAVPVPASATGDVAPNDLAPPVAPADAAADAAADAVAAAVAAAPDPTTFASTADSGWHAAQAAVAATDESSFTKAGLPKRVPRNRLVPGSAGPAGPPPEPTRDAEAVRGRLTTFQRGIRDGREGRDRPDGD